MVRKYVRFEVAGQQRYGVLEGETIHALAGNFLITDEQTGETFATGDVRLLAPTRPTKVMCIGLNYRAHAAERNKKIPEEPMLFLKPPSAVIGTGEQIVLPKIAQNVEFEGELAIVIGKRAENVSVEEARDVIFGVTVMNDVSERYYQDKDGQWGRAKGFNTFAPVGPCVVAGLDYQDLQIETKINGEVKQSSRTSDMIFPVDLLVSFVSQVMTLEPGDVLTTGTPEGVGPLQAGDRVEITIEGVGTLVNTVRAQA
ncbi:fumarylacetoacetate hydrolase family protein [Tumebacillus permanentifrigoris]|uniref:2-keto-4-pentenoate hydratase/2-oxohepta-3-ene-1,7-dioic acid hydratase in catechol pathway n=1 Tax=Tumebacillus permanentifrigoris TaxID=378543 RepID=A0A316DBJ1_9BACL|nr:fumarylacetoacetate hydrolase family protein [Tumebacillus permanentifrigoris]PWK14266.1 2-keto-4-pentenoate hydratase/2-oxohepta-3-ene-1,7-dioic acid hydratase in catechol pathway [Tumebacillus permanentifrigoris]